MKLKKIFSLLSIFFIGLVFGFILNQKIKINFQKTQPKDPYLEFFNEVWLKIKDNYWEKIEENQLTSLFLTSQEKLFGQPIIEKVTTKKDLEKLIKKTLKQIPDEEKKREYLTKLIDLTLTSLSPFGRSRLYSQRQEEELKKTVANINPQVNQYQILEVEKEATKPTIEKAYQEKINQLQNQQSTESAKKLTQIEKAYRILSDEANRKIYDQSGIEPTIDWRLITSDIYYLKIAKFSPTTLDELTRFSEATNQQPQATTLILDLRDNIGGAIDLLPWFLGPFIGPDQYGYQFYHQKEKIDFKTKTGWLPGLVKFKKVVVLINKNTQSTAEVFASVLKKYNVGVLIGETTRGWGTIEKIFPLNSRLTKKEKYSLFLVHSLTLDENGQPIEGKGIEPAIKIDNPNFEKELFSYFHYPELIKIVAQLFKPS